MGQKAIDWTEKYRLDIRPLLNTDPNEIRLFITDYGEPFKREFLSEIVKRYLDKADIKAIKDEWGHVFLCHIVAVQIAVVKLHRVKSCNVHF